MATIDIGKIKPVFKGAYNNSTAYVLDDILYYNGSSYVAKQSTTGNVPTNGTYWNVLASGSGGIWNSSLSLGSANQVVKVNSGATALEFGTLSSGLLPLVKRDPILRTEVNRSQPRRSRSKRFASCRGKRAPSLRRPLLFGLRQFLTSRFPWLILKRRI